MKILIVKTSSLGDIVHAFPSVSLLRSKYPSAQIDWVVEKPFAELVRAHPAINEVIVIHTKAWRRKFFSKTTWQEIFKVRNELRKHVYDLVFDLQGNTKSALVTCFALGKTKIGYGLKTVWEYPNLLVTHVKYNPAKSVNVREENLFLVKEHCQIKNEEPNSFLFKLSDLQKERLRQILDNPLFIGSKKILVSPGSNWKNKQLSKETLLSFLQEIQVQDCCTFLLTYGSEEEKQVARHLKNHLTRSLMVDKLPFVLLQNLMHCMDLVIAMDSLPLHLAATAGVKTLGVFGPSSANKYAPPGAIHQAIQGSCPYEVKFDRRCSRLRTCSTGACMKGMSAATLFKKYREK